jgi:hypothetical protein
MFAEPQVRKLVANTKNIQNTLSRDPVQLLPVQILRVVGLNYENLHLRSPEFYLCK